MWETTMVSAEWRAYRPVALVSDPAEARQARFSRLDDQDAAPAAAPARAAAPAARSPVRWRGPGRPRSWRLLHLR